VEGNQDMTSNGQEKLLSYEGDFFIEPYKLRQKEEWDAFVASSRNGTVFHTQTFLSYHPTGRFQDASILLRDAKGRLRAVFPAAITRDPSGKRLLSSHAGSTYGGLVIDRNFNLKEAFLAVKSLEAYAQSLGAQALEIRHSEKIFHTIPSEELDFALERCGFQPCRRELSSAILVDGLTLESMLANSDESNRRYTKKALRAGVEVSLSDDYVSFHKMLTANLANRHLTRPTHTIDEMERIRELMASHTRLFAAFIEGAMAAGAWLLLCNSKTTHTFYLSQDYRFQHLRPLRAVIHELIRWHIGQGYRYLNLGISTENGGQTVNWGLFQYKESFGARGVIRTTYRKDFV
jgi:hypothetical protein